MGGMNGTPANSKGQPPVDGFTQMAFIVMRDTEAALAQGDSVVVGILRGLRAQNIHLSIDSNLAAGKTAMVRSYIYSLEFGKDLQHSVQVQTIISMALGLNFEPAMRALDTAPANDTEKPQPGKETQQ